MLKIPPPASRSRRAPTLQAAAAAALAAVAGVGAAAAAAPVRECGSMPARYVFKVQADRVTCERALVIARQWGEQCAQLRTGSCLVTAGFYCRYRDSGFERGTIRCLAEREMLARAVSPRRVSFITAS
jgi:hypothetical protein